MTHSCEGRAFLRQTLSFGEGFRAPPTDLLLRNSFRRTLFHLSHNISSANRTQKSLRASYLLQRSSSHQHQHQPPTTATMSATAVRGALYFVRLSKEFDEDAQKTLAWPVFLEHDNLLSLNVRAMKFEAGLSLAAFASRVLTAQFETLRNQLGSSMYFSLFITQPIYLLLEQIANCNRGRGLCPKMEEEDVILEASRHSDHGPACYEARIDKAHTGFY